jgi:hypothetical protein
LSAPGKVKTGWLNQNYDKLILAVVLVLLLGSAAFLGVQITAKRKAFDEGKGQTAGGAGKELAEADPAPFNAVLELLESPFQLGAQNKRLMVGEVRVWCVEKGEPIPYNATNCPFCKAAQPPPDEEPDHDGDLIPDKDEQALGLNPLDPADARADMDGDGFSNFEEWKAKTGINKADEFPPLVFKLRVVRTVVQPFKFRFITVSRLSGTQEVFQLNMRTLDKTYFKTLGEEVEGYKLISYDPKGPEGLPVLTLRQGDATVRLVQGRTETTDARTAILVSLLDRKTYRVKVGDTVKVRDQEYKVVDIKENRVVLLDEQTAKTTVVGPVTDEERANLQRGGQEGQPVPMGMPANAPLMNRP